MFFDNMLQTLEETVAEVVRPSINLEDNYYTPCSPERSMWVDKKVRAKLGRYKKNVNDCGNFAKGYAYFGQRIVKLPGTGFFIFGSSITLEYSFGIMEVGGSNMPWTETKHAVNACFDRDKNGSIYMFWKSPQTGKIAMPTGNEFIQYGLG